MKTKKRNEAIDLRKNGHSINEIAKNLGVSKGSVSVWVRNIELSDFQKQHLMLRNPIYNNQLSGAKGRKIICEDRRKIWQAEGRQIAKNKDSEFVAGCMLYWGEGHKDKNCCGLNNSDPDMIRFYMHWLRKFFKVNEQKISISINAYVNNGLTIDEIEEYWLKITNLTKANCKKHMINFFPRSSSGWKKGKLLYGVCTIKIGDTSIVQKIFGAIKEIASIEDSSKWIF